MPSDVHITLIILVAMVTGVPILGVTLRLAIKPIVEARIVPQDSLGAPGPLPETEVRLGRPEGQVRPLTRALESGGGEGNSQGRTTGTGLSRPDGFG